MDQDQLNHKSMFETVYQTMQSNLSSKLFVIRLILDFARNEKILLNIL